MTMQSLRNTFLLRFFWGIMALHLINLSIDAPDFNPSYIPEDLNFNKQESITEFVVEKLLGYDEAFEEMEESETEQVSLKKTTYQFWSLPNLPFTVEHNSYSHDNETPKSSSTNQYSNPDEGTFSPPPEI